MKKRNIIKKAAAIMICAGIAAGLGSAGIYASDGEEKSGFFPDLAQSLGEAANAAGEAAAGLMDAAGETATGLANAAGETATGLANAAGETATGLADSASGIMDAAGETTTGLMDAAGETAAGLADAAGELASSVPDPVTREAGELLQTLGDNLAGLGGTAAELAQSSYGTLSSAVREAGEQLQENSARIMEIARNAVSGMGDLDSENMTVIRTVIRTAMGEANEQGLFGRTLHPETLDILADLTSGAILYGDLYQSGEISFWEYAANMTAVIVRAGLPVGAEFLGNTLPVPGAGYLAREAAEYLIGSLEGQELSDLFASVVPEGAGISDTESP